MPSLRLTIFLLSTLLFTCGLCLQSVQKPIEEEPDKAVDSHIEEPTTLPPESPLESYDETLLEIARKPVSLNPTGKCFLSYFFSQKGLVPCERG